VQLLKKRLNKERLINYDLHYLTGAYPEGDALLDLFIHPLDLICYLFGQPEILACQHLSDGSYLLMLRHPQIVGTLELSTSYSWSAAEESLKVCTRSGLYRLTKMEELIFTPSPSTIVNIPIEKLRPHDKSVDYLYQCNSFTPILANNPIYSQGYYSELQSFITSVEHDTSNVLTDITTLKSTYEILMGIKRLFIGTESFHLCSQFTHSLFP
jgi:virulence factor